VLQIIQVKGLYTDLGSSASILTEFPNTGSKRMAGYLLNRNIQVTQVRVWEIMKELAPFSVFRRTTENPAFVRRVLCAI
jgi:hypothetical protein